MSRPRTVAIVMGAATVAVAASAVVRHVRGASKGRAVRGGIVIGALRPPGGPTAP
jgi:hypothetical protein